MERDVTGKNSLGLVEFAPVSMLQTEIPSISCSQRVVSDGSTPTRVKNVGYLPQPHDSAGQVARELCAAMGYQSATWMNVLECWPRKCPGK